MISTADFLAHVSAHVNLAGSALIIALLAALPLGVLCAHDPRFRAPVLSVVNVARVIPSLAMLTLMLPFLGVGFKSSVAALILLAIPPIAINTDLAFRAVPSGAREAARGMGMTFWQSLFRVEFPLAMPVIFTGVRTAAVELIASATLAAFIGGGGLGEYITRGLAANDPHLLITGALAVAALAIAVEVALRTTSRILGERL